jgi:glyoxylase-like metal-dependent hydrolase (beta-lactamase superfamily II)
MILDSMVCNMMQTNAYFFGDEETKEVVIIDAGGEVTAIIARIENKGYKPIGLIATHGHPDHTGGIQACGTGYGSGNYRKQEQPTGLCQ